MTQPTPTPTKRRCPDDGGCHHSCQGADCFRVRYAGPLSGVYPGDTWPAEVRDTVRAAADTGVL